MANINTSTETKTVGKSNPSIGHVLPTTEFVYRVYKIYKEYKNNKNKR